MPVAVYSHVLLCLLHVILCRRSVMIIVRVFFFQALYFLVESFGLLNDLFPFPSILDAGYPVFDLHLADILCDVILPSVLGSCDLLVRGFQLNIFFTVLVSGVLCT